MYNKRLKHKILEETIQIEKEDHLIVQNVHSDNEWIADPNDDAEYSNENEDIETEEIESR